MRVTYRTFGCKANQYDTERMRQALEALGSTTVPADGDPAVWVVNTCTVTNQADADARRFIRKVHREHPEARIVVTGCSAVLKQAEYEAMPGVSSVVPGHEAEAVARAAAPDDLVQLTVRRPPQRMDFEPIGGELLQRRAGRSRGWLKVQDGCDRNCSFCATRLARGASRSRMPAQVVAEATALARHHPEIVITGIHIGHYGRDLQGDEATTLSKLVAELLETLPDVRFRLGSIEATEVDDLLVRLLRESGGSLAPHLHMPLQSGADSVLRRMRRWHTREAYRSRALEIAEAVPRLGLGADIITGFPGESEHDHGRTRALVEELPFTYLHVFPYSPRDGTVAADLDQGVPQRVAGERARDLRLLGQEKGEAYIASRAGERVVVVPEGKGTGLTEDYVRVQVRSPDPWEHAPPLLRATLQLDASGPYIEPTSSTAKAALSA